MALDQTIKDIQAQNAQLQDMFLNLKRGIVRGNPEGTKDDQLERLQTEMAIMKVQMMGQLVGQMALIQNLARGQEELRVLINKLYQDKCNQLGQTVRVED